MALLTKRIARALPALLLAALAPLALGACASVSGLETRARILSQPPCTDFFFPLYFARGASGLTKQARAVVDNAGLHAREGCMIAQVQVIGLADWRGPPDDRLTLSRARARSVAQALDAAGLTGATFQVSPLGNAAVADPAPADRRRRADVFIRFQH